jgi:hypothetical protein
MSFYKKYYPYTKMDRSDKIDALTMFSFFLFCVLVLFIGLIIEIIEPVPNLSQFQMTVFNLFMFCLFLFGLLLVNPFRSSVIDINSERIIITDSDPFILLSRLETYLFKYPFNVDLSVDKTSLLIYYPGYWGTRLNLIGLTEEEKRTVIDLLKQQPAVSFRERQIRPMKQYLIAPPEGKKPI